MDADDPPTTESDDHITLTTRAEAFAELADLDDEPTHAGTIAHGEKTDEASTEAGDADAAPPVVLVAVVHNADETLDDLLASLETQTYANLSVLVIDAASDIDPTPRVATVLPGAFVRRLESNAGFGPTVNEILELVSGASFYCICHDDVVLDDDCVHELVAEAFRSNAGIVGPKALDWDDPERLLSVGFTIDRSAGRAPYAERHELDQGQHDAVRDVFAVSGGCTLVRSDLFEHLGGFDPGIDLLGEDLDLCWRAHLVGARVVVAPQARVRHRERLSERVEADRLVRVDAAHRLRTVLTNYRLAHLVILIPALVLTTLVEAIVESAIGRRGHARAQLGAWGTNLRATRSILRSRRHVRSLRERGDRAIAQLQTKTWARLDGLVQAHRRASTDASFDEVDGLIPADSGYPETGTGDDDSDGFVRTGAPRRSYSSISWGIVGLIVVLVIGTRELFFGSIPAIGGFADPPRGLGALWRTWLGAWNPVGLGSSTAPAAGLAPLAIVGTILGGALGLMRHLGILLPIPIGLFGVWRLARPLASRRAQFVALVIYAVVPVPWNALAQGRWGGLLVYAAAPWVTACAIRAMKVAPFGDLETADAGVQGRPWWSPLLGFGLLLAIVGMLVPAVAIVVVVVAIGLIVGSVVSGRLEGLGRMVLTTIGAVVVAAILVSPWTFVGPARSAWTLAGLGGGVHGWLGLGDILRFQSGPMGAGVLGYLVLVAAALPLVIGRSWRFTWGVRAWSMAGSCFAAVWVGQQDWFSVPSPPPEVFLAAAAAAIALAAAIGASAVEADLPSFRFGWAQGASVVATVALVASVLPLLGNAADGRWKMAPLSLDQALDFVTTEAAAKPFRVLWVGDPSVLPVAGWRLDDATSVGITNHGMAEMTELWAPANPGGARAIVDALDLATGSETTRVGRILADMGIRYVILPRQNVPLPYRSPAHEPSTDLLSSLDDQLDLSRTSANDAVIVYRNEAFRSTQRVYPSGTPVGASIADTLDTPVGQPLARGVDPTRSTRFVVPTSGILATGQPADPSWRLRVAGRRAKPVTLWGWEQGFVVPKAGPATLSRSNGIARPIVLGLVALAWVVVIAAWVLGRRRSSEDDGVAVEHRGTKGTGSLVHLGSGPSDPDENVAAVRVGDGAPGPSEPDVAGRVTDSQANSAAADEVDADGTESDGVDSDGTESDGQITGETR